MAITPYVLTATQNSIRYVDASGNIHTLTPLSSGDAVYSANGGFHNLQGMAIDNSGNMYIFDNKPASGIAVLYRVTSSGSVTHLAGKANVAGQSGMGGLATSAGLAGSTNAVSVLLDAAGNIYLNDYNSSTILAINTQSTTQTLYGVSISAGCIQIIAGTPGSAGNTGNGGAATASKITCRENQGLAIDAGGNLYFADHVNAYIRKITSAGTISAYIGNGSTLAAGDGGAIGTAETGAAALYFDAHGNLFIYDTVFNTIRVVNNQAATQSFYGVSIPPGCINKIAGTGSFTDSGDGGQALSAGLSGAATLVIDANGNLILGEYGYYVRAIAPSGVISTIAGTGTQGNTGDGGAAASAQIGSVYGLVFGTPSAGTPVTPGVIAETQIDAYPTGGASNEFVRFRLRNFAGKVPVATSGVLATITATLDAGSVAQNVIPNTAISPAGTFYTCEIWANGRITTSGNVTISASGDLSTLL